MYTKRPEAIGTIARNTAARGRSSYPWVRNTSANSPGGSRVPSAELADNRIPARDGWSHVAGASELGGEMSEKLNRRNRVSTRGQAAMAAAALAWGASAYAQSTPEVFWDGGGTLALPATWGDVTNWV